MSITVFLADDHAVVRDGLGFLLDAQPDITLMGTAADGREAVEAIAKSCPNVVLMDITMPHLNGIDATNQVCQKCPATQVIILSMHASVEHIVTALQAGARGYLLKESAGSEVINAVRSVHAGQRYLSQKISDTMIDDYLQQHYGAPDTKPLATLSSREREVLQLVVEGKSSADIAQVLSLSPKTVETYRSRMMQKLNINDLPSLVRFAIHHGLTPME